VRRALSRVVIKDHELYSRRFHRDPGSPAKAAVDPLVSEYSGRDYDEAAALSDVSSQTPSA